MDATQFEKLLAVLTRIADAMEQQAASAEATDTKRNLHDMIKARASIDAKPFADLIVQHMPELEGKWFRPAELFVAIGYHKPSRFDFVSLGKAARLLATKARSTNTGAKYLF